MAEEDRSDLAFLPEEKVAWRLLGKYRLAPPVDIGSLLSEMAEVEVADLPVDADAITLHLKDSQRRPHVILNRNRPLTRRRFTCAHELGHIAIPWHVGTMTVSHVSGHRRFLDPIYRQMEAEANRFASEILMPTQWIKGLFEQEKEIVRLHEHVAEIAQVSSTTSALALTRSLPRGFAFVELEKSTGRVLYAAQSAGTWVNLPSIGEIMQGNPFLTTPTVGAVTTGHGTIHWGDFSQATASDTLISDGLDWRETLDAIFSDLKLTDDAKKAHRMSISGIVGSANQGVRERNLEALVHVFRGRFSGRPELQDVITHPRFEEFLRRRARDILSPERATKRRVR